MPSSRAGGGAITEAPGMRKGSSACMRCMGVHVSSVAVAHVAAALLVLALEWLEDLEEPRMLVATHASPRGPVEEVAAIAASISCGETIAPPSTMTGR
jgi:hypothetical protein